MTARFATLLTLAATLVAALGAAEAFDRRIRIKNDTGQDIVSLSASSAESGWSGQVLGGLSAGQAAMATIDDGSGACTHPAKPDTDADGTCDEQDPCTNVGGGQDFVSRPKSTVGLTNINTDPRAGNDSLKISAEFQLGAGKSFAGLNPLAQGARVVIRSASGVTRVDLTLPGGAYAGRGTRGWALNKAGNGWSYTDSTAASLGIRRLKIGDRSKKAPRRVKVLVTGARSLYPVVTGDAPIEAIVVLGDQAAATAGACGESSYSPAQCAFNATGDALRCK